MNKKKKSMIAAIVILIVVLIGAGLLYYFFGPQSSAGAKNVTIAVTDDTGKTVTYDVKTDAEYLHGAMDDADGLEFSGEESEYGMMIDTVNGIRADYNKDGAYWSFTVNGEYSNYGIDEQPVADNDSFTIDYTKAE